MAIIETVTLLDVAVHTIAPPDFRIFRTHAGDALVISAADFSFQVKLPAAIAHKLDPAASLILTIQGYARRAA